MVYLRIKTILDGNLVLPFIKKPFLSTEKQERQKINLDYFCFWRIN